MKTLCGWQEDLEVVLDKAGVEPTKRARKNWRRQTEQIMKILEEMGIEAKVETSAHKLPPLIGVVRNGVSIVRLEYYSPSRSLLWGLILGELPDVRIRQVREKGKWENVFILFEDKNKLEQYLLQKIKLPSA